MVAVTFCNVHELNLENIRANMAKQEKNSKTFQLSSYWSSKRLSLKENAFKIQTHKPSTGDSITVHFCKGI